MRQPESRQTTPKKRLRLPNHANLCTQPCCADEPIVLSRYSNGAHRKAVLALWQLTRHVRFVPLWPFCVRRDNRSAKRNYRKRKPSRPVGYCGVLWSTVEYCTRLSDSVWSRAHVCEPRTSLVCQWLRPTLAGRLATTVQSSASVCAVACASAYPTAPTSFRGSAAAVRAASAAVGLADRSFEVRCGQAWPV